MLPTSDCVIACGARRIRKDGILGSNSYAIEVFSTCGSEEQQIVQFELRQ
jgi:hypothetical protein